MFDEVPSRRITQRRTALRDALVAAIGVVGGAVEFLRKGKVDWETIGWTLVFLAGVYTYWKKRHKDPWWPPLEDAPEPQSTGQSTSDI
jgi:hypothetical protein